MNSNNCYLNMISLQYYSHLSFQFTNKNVYNIELYTLYSISYTNFFYLRRVNICGFWRPKLCSEHCRFPVFSRYIHIVYSRIVSCKKLLGRKNSMGQQLENPRSPRRNPAFANHFTNPFLYFTII